MLSMAVVIMFRFARTAMKTISAALDQEVIDRGFGKKCLRRAYGTDNVWGREPEHKSLP